MSEMPQDKRCAREMKENTRKVLREVEMLRCQKCIIPANYPGAAFDNQGVCDFCGNYRRIEYRGAEALKSQILSYRSRQGASKYDCALGFSGGRDSTYLLFYLSEILKLKVLAFTIDNGNIPPETLENIRNITKSLSIDLITRKFPYLEKCFGHHLNAWLHKPSPAMITALCVGCRLGLAKGEYEFLQEHRIPVCIIGGTPFEGGGYKTDILRIPSNSKTKSSLILGYLHQAIRNPRWISNPYAFTAQAREFMACYGHIYDKELRRKGYVFILPFYEYIRWEEEKVMQTLNQLGWRKNSQTGSTWRGDCNIASLKLYLYKALLGYNDKDDSFSALIRDGQLTREEAVHRLKDEQYISEDIIKSTIEKAAINYGYFQQVMSKVCKISREDTLPEW